MTMREYNIYSRQCECTKMVDLVIFKFTFNLHHLVRNIYYKMLLLCHALYPKHEYEVGTTPMLAPEDGAVCKRGKSSGRLAW